MDKHDHEMQKKIDRIRTLLEKNQAQHGSTDRVTKQTYDYLKEGLTTTSGQWPLPLPRLRHPHLTSTPSPSPPPSPSRFLSSLSPPCQEATTATTTCPRS